MKTSLATFNCLGGAEAFQRRLSEAGIRAVIHDESRLERFWFMAEPLAAIHIDVEQRDFLKAREVLVEWEATGDVNRSMAHCPECGSSRVEFPQITRKFLTPVFQTVFMYLHLMPREYYCEDCHFTWPKVKPVEPVRDVLNFPVNSGIGIPEMHPIRSLRQRFQRKHQA